MWIMLALCLPQGVSRARRSRNALSVAINRRLLQHYAPYHFELQCAAVSALRHRAQCRLYVRNHLAGFLCALLFSADARKRRIGVQLAHAYALRGLGRARRETQSAYTLN